MSHTARVSRNGGTPAAASDVEHESRSSIAGLLFDPMFLGGWLGGALYLVLVNKSLTGPPDSVDN